MRVCTAFNRILGLAGATVASVTFAPEGIIKETDTAGMHIITLIYIL